MKIQIDGIITFDNERYSYTATHYRDTKSGQACWEVCAVESVADQNIAISEQLFDYLVDLAIADAKERLLFRDSLRSDETLEEGMRRLALLWHPEELKPTKPKRVPSLELFERAIVSTKTSMQFYRATGHDYRLADESEILKILQELKDRFCWCGEPDSHIADMFSENHAGDES